MGSAAPASCFLTELQALAFPSDRLQAGSLSKSFPLQLFVVMVFIETQLREYSTMLWQHDPFKIFTSVGLIMPSWHLVSPVPLHGAEAVAASCLALTVPRSFASSFLLFSGQLLFLFPPLSECCFRISDPGLIDKLKGESPMNF